MISHIIEVNGANFNWGKFMLLQYDKEWLYRSRVDCDSAGENGAPLLWSMGKRPGVVWVLDLQTGEGATFHPEKGSIAKYELCQKHKIWVCPMFEPFLEWLYQNYQHDITKLPALVTFGPEIVAQHADLSGYRRSGSEIQADAGSRDPSLVNFTGVGGGGGGHATVPLREQVRALHAEGLAAGQVAARLGIALPDVLAILGGRIPAPTSRANRRGPARQNPHGKLSPAELAVRNEQIAVLIESGQGPKAIAVRLGIGRTTVQHICQSLRRQGRLPPSKPSSSGKPLPPDEPPVSSV